ncbi:EAL domain-containing protein [Lacimicrobium alkaliphilum]|uniref:EAL domain-containing protein n=1 Tax=Lacimicrobium alkaliphilum TaxID=1526571 RepID=A0ABQ1R181_9ALTE|nr:GGDEF domain-containing phosphodiesterase [Lacimicrobium alkaliphilum]GGD54566.1 hypothetical protein GCM10011357_07860 [Lacimicrobium alkaliphilum]
MLTGITNAIKQYLLLDQKHLKTPDENTWKLSVLRLILTSGVILTSAIVIHSSYAAYTQNLYYVLVMTFSFSALLWGAMSLSKDRIAFTSASLTITIVLAGFCILFFTHELASARYGLLLFFTLPIILRLCYGNKAAVAGMLLNIIPFVILLINQPLAPLLGIDMSLPGTYIYLSSLVFLFFNFCLPVAVIRVLTSLEKQSQLNREQSKKLGTVVKRYQEIFNNGGTPSFFCNQQGKILHANKSGRKLMQNAPADCSFIYELFALTKPLAAEETEIAALRSDTNAIYKIQPASLVHHKKQLIHCFDISHTTAADKKIGLLKRKHFTRHYSDALTELKNHHFWSHQFPQSLEHDHTVILLKLANLKDINLQYSFSVGDQVLANVAALLRNQLSSSVNLYRFPGAKFLLCVNTDQSSTENIPDWLNRHLPATVTQPMEKGKDGILINLQWRSGYCNTSGFTSAALLAEACAIGLSQTTQSQPFEQYDSKVVKLIRQDTRNKDRIKRLLDEGSLALWLQSQVDDLHNVTGFEVLARLDDPVNKEILQPYQFLPQIEKNKWHILFTQKVLDKAILLLESWPVGLPDVPLAVNLSGPELLDDAFYEKLLRRFSESRFLRDKLKLELTETSVLASHDETKKRLTSLANVGATIIIDDFGTGHASLSQLIDLSASVLKVDREFVDRIESSERHRKIVKMTLELANTLDMKTIAEGVETEAQLTLLKQMGFTCFQGYFFGKPAPIGHWSEGLGSKAM